jgi:hypothetical protein
MKKLVLKELSLGSTKTPDTISDILLVSLTGNLVHVTFVQGGRLDGTLANIGAAHPQKEIDYGTAGGCADFCVGTEEEVAQNRSEGMDGYQRGQGRLVGGNGVIRNELAVLKEGVGEQKFGSTKGIGLTVKNHQMIGISSAAKASFTDSSESR